MSLHSFSNTNLSTYFENLVRTERKITGQVLQCIAEIDRRKLYMKNNHTSLFDYLTKDFGYSPGAAMRRIDGARLLRELPEVAEKFENGALTLSQATQVQRAARDLKKTKNEFISSEQKRDLILQIENSSQKETEQTISAALDLPVIPVQKETTHRDQSVTLTITFTPEQMQMIEQVQNMISHSVPNNSWADVFTYLAHKEVARRTNLPSTNRRSKKSPTAVAAAKSQKDQGNPSTKRQIHPSNHETLSSNFAILQNPSPLATATAVKRSQRPAIPAKDRKRLLHPQRRM